MHVIAAYTPQAGCDKNEKDKFWMNIGDFLSTVPMHESVLLGADLNGHIGQKHDGRMIDMA